jgi:hypothetical protein
VHMMHVCTSFALGGWDEDELRLFNTAALACSKSGKRRTDLVLLRLLLELGFCFITGGLRATDQ